MTLIGDLFALQETDNAVDACERSLEQVRAQFGESEELAELRIGIVDLEAELRAAQARSRDLEVQIVDIRAKVTPVEQRLFGGSLRNPKELQALQEDLDMLKRHQREAEDRELVVMEDLERLAAALAARRTQASELEQAWESGQAGLREREVQLTVERGRLATQRQARAGRVPSQPLAQYERLRAARRGVAVVRVERGTCGGCRVMLPSGVQQRARNTMQIVQCTSCERILFAG